MTIPEDLLSSFKRGKGGVFVGAGVSISAGLPSWKNFLEKMIDFASEVANLPESKKNSMKGLLGNPEKFLMIAEELKEYLASDFNKFINLTFKDQAPGPSEIHKAIIEVPSKFTITTNYDNLLERAYAQLNGDIPNTFTFKEGSDIIFNLFNDKYFILKAHGDASRPHQGIILTENDYRIILYKEPGYKSILENLFASNSLLFLGSSLQDPELRLLLGYVHNAFQGSGPKHYALINKDELSEVEIDRWRKDYNISIIPYDSVNNHQFVLDFVQTLTRHLKQD
jgi:hypothetical protein